MAVMMFFEAGADRYADHHDSKRNPVKNGREMLRQPPPPSLSVGPIIVAGGKVTHTIPGQLAETPRGVKRTRKAHSKVRTGCLTCKIRRKKCDETKPACERCTSTGRKCDGYVVAPPSPPPAVAAQPSEKCFEEQNGALPLSPVPSGVRYIDVSVPLEPRITELDMETVDSSPCVTDETVDDIELSNFILSYGIRTAPLSPDSLSQDSTSIVHSPASTHSSPSSRSDSRTRHRQRPRQWGQSVPHSLSLFPKSISSIDSSCFSYFREITGPSFASYFDSSIWRNYTVSAALAHPAVFCAAAALGAVHRRYTYGISREAFEYCAHAARLHAQATRDLKELKDRIVNENLIGTASSGGCGMGVCDRDAIMTCEMLLGLYEGFQSNYETSVQHMHNGMQYLLARPMTLVHSETQYCAVESKPNTFCRLFHQLHCRALHLFGSPTNILVSWGQGLPLPEIPDVFLDLEEARDLLFTETDWIMHAPARVWEDTHERSEAQKLHVTRLLKWSVAYADTVKHMERTPLQKKACMLMKLTRNATYLLLYLTLFVAVDTGLPRMPNMDDEIDNDPEQDSILAYANKSLWEMVQKREYLSANLARSKVFIENMLDENSVFSYDEHSISFDTAYGPPAASQKMPDTSNKTRHLVKRILQQNVGTVRDGEIFKMMGVYGVAERISALEEHAVISAIRKIIPEHLDPRWVCITCMMESRKILLRYCRPDAMGLGMVWTQEWWAF